MAIETLFDPPHSATEEEIARVLAVPPGVANVRAWVRSLPHDDCLTLIWNLYQYRGDEAAMRAVEARFEDPLRVEMELRYRDVFPVLPES